MTVVARLRTARLLGATAALVPALALLIGLGAWQWTRMEWKAGLMAEIRARTTAPAVPLDEAMRRTGGSRPDDQEYLRVRVRGRFDHAGEKHVFVTGADGPGYHIYTPLIGVDPPLQVLVNRGFVPQDLRDPARRPDGQIAGVTEITGFLRHPRSREWFTVPSEPERNQFFYPDFLGMIRDRAGPGRPAIAPFFIEADATPNPGGWPKGGVTRLELPNRHLEYALTWWSFAASLIGVYVVFAWQRLRATSPGVGHDSRPLEEKR